MERGISLSKRCTAARKRRTQNDQKDPVAMPDDTDMEQITDGGVCGLAAWGPHIFYQDIDDPYV